MEQKKKLNQIGRLTLREAREILGDSAADFDDIELKELLIQMAQLAELYISAVPKS